MSASTIPLSAPQLQQALAILDREQPSSVEQDRFHWLNWAVWSVLGFSTAWLVVVISNSRVQIIPLLLALLAAAAVLVLFLANLPFLRKCWKAVQTERRLGISRNVSTLTARVRSRAGWSATWKTFGLLGLMPLGVILVPLGGLALLGELWDFPPVLANLPLPVWTLTFGIACLCLYPMEVCRERLDAVARLRATVLAGTDLEDPVRDLITSFERTQILVARQEGAAGSAGDRSAGGVRFTRTFLESLSKLSADEMTQVYAALPLLQGQARVGDQSGAGTQVSMFNVPDTSLRIELTRNLTSGEVALEQLHRTEQQCIGQAQI